MKILLSAPLRRYAAYEVLQADIKTANSFHLDRSASCKLMKVAYWDDTFKAAFIHLRNAVPWVCLVVAIGLMISQVSSGSLVLPRTKASWNEVVTCRQAPLIDRAC